MDSILFFIGFLILASLHFYLFIRGLQAIPSNWIISTLYIVLFLFMAGSFIYGFFINENPVSKSGYYYMMIGKSWVIFFIFLLFATIFADLLRVLNYSFRIFPEWVISNYSKVKLIYFISVLLVSGIICLYGFNWFFNTTNVDLNLTINKERGHYEDLTIISASDLHIGEIIRKEKLADWVKIINSKDPDIILLTGDLFDNSFDFNESLSVETELLKLKSRYGIYAILGNQEYYAGVEKSINCLEKSGIKLLRDQTITIENSFVIIGRDDATNSKRKPLDSLILNLDPGIPKILMDHQPFLSESVKNKIDLQISGHLHNGQIYPRNLLASREWELVYGYRKIGDTQFYVTSGLGLSNIPIRLGTQSEIVQIKLNQKSSTLARNNSKP